jgi:hypothetical protein
VLLAVVANEAARNRAIRKADEAWRSYASSHNMTYQASRGWLTLDWPRMEGVRGELNVAVEVATRITQLDRSTAFLALPKAPVDGTVELTREGIASAVAKLFGAQDIELGDEAFDRAFVVKATSPELAHTLFPASIRRVLLELEIDRVVYEQGAAQACVAVERVGIVISPEELDRCLDVAAQIAHLLS